MINLEGMDPHDLYYMTRKLLLASEATDKWIMKKKVVDELRVEAEAAITEALNVLKGMDSDEK